VSMSCRYASCGMLVLVQFLFARPDSPGRLRLPGQPVLESWMAVGHPDQQRLARYLDELERLTVAAMGDRRHLSLELRVGLGASIPLTSGGNDLDNYVYPVVRRLKADRFDVAFADKDHAGSSTICVGDARLADWAVSEPLFGARTTASGQAREWKEQVYHACRRAIPAPLPPGPVALDLRFTVARTRNWSNLWKPAIDALGPMLGIPNPARPFHPLDDRVVSLGLHRIVDERIGWGVIVDVWCQER
jgi:hypothetical protein